MRLALAAQHLGVHPNTVRNWAESGKLPCTRIGTRGDRRFIRSDLDELLGQEPPSAGREAHYVRVSGRGDQLSSLQAQEAELEAAATGPVTRVYRDVGSGLSERRRGLTRLLDAASRHEFEIVRVTHADRLSRFGVSYLERLLAAYDVELVIEHAPAGAAPPAQDELLADFMSLVSSFAGRIYGQRSAATRRRLLARTQVPAVADVKSSDVASVPGG